MVDQNNGFGPGCFIADHCRSASIGVFTRRLFSRPFRVSIRATVFTRWQNTCLCKRPRPWTPLLKSRAIQAVQRFQTISGQSSFYEQTTLFFLQCFVCAALRFCPCHALRTWTRICQCGMSQLNACLWMRRWPGWPCSWGGPSMPCNDSRLFFLKRTQRFHTVLAVLCHVSVSAMPCASDHSYCRTAKASRVSILKWGRVFKSAWLAMTMNFTAGVWIHLYYGHMAQSRCPNVTSHSSHALQSNALSLNIQKRGFSRKKPNTKNWVCNYRFAQVWFVVGNA